MALEKVVLPGVGLDTRQPRHLQRGEHGRGRGESGAQRGHVTLQPAQRRVHAEPRVAIRSRSSATSRSSVSTAPASVTAT